MGRLPVRERVRALLDKDSPFFEIGLWAAYKMYEEWGKIPAAESSPVSGISKAFRAWWLPTTRPVKAGAFFPADDQEGDSRAADRVRVRLPLVYLVDSAGVFLPMQDEIFPDEDDSAGYFAITR